MERSYCLVIVVPDAQKLIIIVVQAGVEIVRRGVPRDHIECSVEQFPDDKPRSVVLASGLFDEPVKLDVLLFGQPERILYRLIGCRQTLFLCLFHFLSLCVRVPPGTRNYLFQSTPFRAYFHTSCECGNDPGTAPCAVKQKPSVGGSAGYELRVSGTKPTGSLPRHGYLPILGISQQFAEYPENFRRL